LTEKFKNKTRPFEFYYLKGCVQGTGENWMKNETLGQEMVGT
jgi:hypothetical protein